jgi:hypothetical protein
VGSFCTEFIQMAQKVENISKVHLRPTVNNGFYCVDFHWSPNYSTKLCAKLLYRIPPNQSQNVATTGRNSFTPRRKVWLSLRRFLWNACLADNFLQRILTPSFMRMLQTVYSLMLSERQADGRMWSLQRTTQTHFYNNYAPCLLCGKDWIFSFCMFGRAIVQAVSRRPLPRRPSLHPSSIREIRGGTSSNGTDFSPSTLASPVSIIPARLYTHLYLHLTFTRRTNGQSLGTFQKARLFPKSDSSG